MGASRMAALEMFAVDSQRVIDTLRAMQHQRCCYGTTDGDGRMCDCKYGWTPDGKGGEKTGCPELRQAIRTLALLKEIS